MNIGEPKSYHSYNNSSMYSCCFISSHCFFDALTIFLKIRRNDKNIYVHFSPSKETFFFIIRNYMCGT